MKTARTLVGYTEARCDDPRGQYYNTRTQRAMWVHADGTARREVGKSLITREHQYTQFAGWWPDGRAKILVGWESEENGIWEHGHRDFRFLDCHWLVDTCLVDLETGDAVNLTAVDRVSFYNVGVHPLPGDSGRLGFSAIIDGQSRPYAMALDGTDKKPVLAADGFIYGIAVSPDGKRVAYASSYKLHLADGDGSNAVRIDTGHPFNFLPTWSPDSQWVLFGCGPNNRNYHPYLIAADGTGLRKLVDRGGYNCAMEALDHPDFHSASSDLPAWSPDSRWVYCTVKVGEAVELLRISVDGKTREELTESEPGVFNYHPAISPCGKWIAFGSTRDGARALYVSRVDGSEVRAITEAKQGRKQMHAHWSAL